MPKSSFESNNWATIRHRESKMAAAQKTNLTAKTGIDKIPFLEHENTIPTFSSTL